MRWVVRGGLSLLVVTLAVVLAFLLLAWPNALYTRHAYTGGNEALAAVMAERVPDGIESLLDQQYVPGETLDVFRPGDGPGPLPVVVWLHGGGWVGGDKADLRPWLQILAGSGSGHVVVGVNYSLAPGERYPTPVRQANEALAWVAENAEEIGADRSRVVLAGDSAGAQVAAQVATLTTSPANAELVGVVPTLAADQLRGVVIASGAVDPVSMIAGGAASGPISSHVAAMTVRSYVDEERAGQTRIASHVTEDYPPVWITSGNADPLEPASQVLAQRLEDLGVDVTPLFYLRAHRPALGHQYQLDLRSADAERALESLQEFLVRVLD